MGIMDSLCTCTVVNMRDILNGSTLNMRDIKVVTFETTISKQLLQCSVFNNSQIAKKTPPGCENGETHTPWEQTLKMLHHACVIVTIQKHKLTIN